MAHIVLTTNGSIGDLNPFLAFGQVLQLRGHIVEFAVEERLTPAVTAAGFVVHPLPNDLQPVNNPEHIYTSASSIRGAKTAFETCVFPTLHWKVEALRAVCSHANLMVSSGLQWPASIVADLTGIPWASVTVTPLSIPSRYITLAPQIRSAPTARQPLINHMVWAASRRLLRSIADHRINQLRTTYGLQPRHDLALTGNLSHTLTAVAVSPTFIQRPVDWPQWASMTGFCFWDTSADWREPAELNAFFESTKPVVVVSSGSVAPIVNTSFTNFYRDSVTAILHSGARALVIGAAPNVLEGLTSSDVFTLPFAPFSRIYPRCAAVIHHGGIGTIAQALRAGVPMLISPWGFDQSFNGGQIASLGAGQYLSRRMYTTRRVAAILDNLLHDAQYKDAAQFLSRKLSHEDGVATMCDTLEGVILT